MTIHLIPLWLPNTGDTFSGRTELIHKLEESGWEFEGEGTSFDDNGKPMQQDVGVHDTIKMIWVMIILDIIPNGVRVSKVYYPTSSPEWNKHVEEQP